MTQESYKRAKEIEEELTVIEEIEESVKKILIRMTETHGKEFKEMITDFCTKVRNESKEEFKNL